MFDKLFNKKRQVDKAFSNKKPSKIWILVGLLYIISPIDLIPDPTVIGIIDDIMVIFLLLSKFIGNDTGEALKRFMERDPLDKSKINSNQPGKQKGPIVEGEIIEEE